MKTTITFLILIWACCWNPIWSQIRLECPEDLELNCAADVPEPNVQEIKAESECDGLIIDHAEDIIEQDGCKVKIIRVYKATNECGEEATCEQVICYFKSTKIEDACGEIIDLGCNPDIIPDPTSLFEDSECDVRIEIVDKNLEEQGCKRTLKYTFFIIDQCGNEKTCEVTFCWIEDTEAPKFGNCPGVIELGCNPRSIPDPNPQEVEAFDECGDVEVFPLDDQLVNEGCFYTLTRVYIAKDKCGNESKCVVIYTWTEDKNAPKIVQAPKDVDLGCNPTEVPDTMLGLHEFDIEDDCGNYTISLGEANFDNDGCRFKYCQKYIIEDDCNNVLEYTRCITWCRDNQAPQIACTAELDLGCNPAIIPAPDPATVVANDNCNWVEVQHIADEKSENGCLHTINRIWVAKDKCGNETACTTQITYEIDVTAPVILAAPEDLVVECGEAPQDLPLLAIEDFEYEDDCGEVTLVKLDEFEVPGDCYTTFCCKYVLVDQCGNETVFEHCIRICSDNEPPTIICPENLDLGCNPASIPQPDPSIVTVNDNCDNDINVVMTASSIFPEGCKITITRTYTATDDAGNQSSCDHVLCYYQSQPLTITECPEDEYRCEF